MFMYAYISVIKGNAGGRRLCQSLHCVWKSKPLDSVQQNCQI